MSNRYYCYGMEKTHLKLDPPSSSSSPVLKAGRASASQGGVSVSSTALSSGGESISLTELSRLMPGAIMWSLSALTLRTLGTLPARRQATNDLSHSCGDPQPRPQLWQRRRNCFRLLSTHPSEANSETLYESLTWTLAIVRCTCNPCSVPNASYGACAAEGQRGASPLRSASVGRGVLGTGNTLGESRLALSPLSSCSSEGTLGMPASGQCAYLAMIVTTRCL